MGNNSSQSKEEQKTLEQLSTDQKTFSRDELCVLLEKFKKKYSTGYMTKEEFIQENISLQGGNETFWADVYDNFTTGNEKTDRITFSDFIIGLTSITNGNEEEKLEWMFNMYDVDGNKTLDRDEVNSLVRGLIKANNEQNKSNEEIAIMANKFFDDMDSDKNGSVDLKEFITLSLKTPFIKDSLTCVMTQSLEVEKSENEFSEFENQVAGHKGKSAMLKDPSGKTIFKPLHPTEFEFYQTLKNYQEIQKFFPKFYGRKVVQEEGSEEVSTYVQMQNLTDGLLQPCICDLKMGYKGYDHTAGKLKIAQQVALCTVTTSSSLGFRMCGMRYFNGSELVVRDKPWGAKLSKSTMQDAIFQFLTRCRFDVALAFSEKLKELLQWFNEQKLFKFFSSSILLIYDAASFEKETIDIKVVDFAHTFPSTDGKIDENYREGLVNLVNIMDKISALVSHIYENQKKKGEQWSRAFLGNDRPEYSNEDGSIAITFRESNLWKVDRDLPNSDDDGWQYASSYKGSWHSVMTKKDTVRRRRWVKK